ncbi:hypothetical protein K8R14_04260 [bacterium]|nr:hypothetical protein [bacterium]
MIQDRVIDQYPEFRANAVFAKGFILECFEKGNGISREKAMDLFAPKSVDYWRVRNFLGDIFLDTLGKEREKWQFTKMEYYFWDKESYCEKCKEIAQEYVENIIIRERESRGYFDIWIIPETSEHEERLVNRLGELGLSDVIMVDKPKV